MDQNKFRALPFAETRVALLREMRMDTWPDFTSNQSVTSGSRVDVHVVGYRSAWPLRFGREG